MLKIGKLGSFIVSENLKKFVDLNFLDFHGSQVRTVRCGPNVPA